MTPLEIASRRLRVREVLRVEGNILIALMLRDISTRFGSAPGFLIAIAWPVSHIIILLAINVFAGRLVPYGDSAVLWFSLGATPFMIASYTSRFMVFGLIMNRPLLMFPAISIFDILVSRILIEVIVSSMVVISLVLILTFLDVDFLPIDTGMAVSALMMSLLLGIGLGVTNSILALIMPQWAVVYSLLTIVLWLTSGAFFVPSNLPGPLRDVIYYHPIMHLIEWTRMAWYEGYSSLVFDKNYVIGFTLVMLCYGLVLERLLRGRLLYA